MAFRYLNTLSDVESLLFQQKKTHMLLTEEEKLMLEHFILSFRPFSEVTTTISGQKYVTVGYVLVLMDELLYHVRDQEHFPETYLKSAAQAVGTVLQKYLPFLYDFGSYVGTFLDPRFKLQNLDVLAENAIFRQQFEKMMENNYGYGLREAIQISQPSSFLQKVARRRNVEIMEGDELVIYGSEPVVAWETDPLEWWKINSSRFPCLAKAARDYLSIQATSVPSESLFSVAGDIARSRRSRLSPLNMRVLVSLKSWIGNGWQLELD
ncbi:hypothetical protein P9112_003659 [Eukaryota sp. TZLM1-RC]